MLPLSSPVTEPVEGDLHKQRNANCFNLIGLACGVTATTTTGDMLSKQLLATTCFDSPVSGQNQRRVHFSLSLGPASAAKTKKILAQIFSSNLLYQSG